MSAVDNNHGNTYAYREVPVEQVREAFERSGVSASELARRLGWVRPDSMRVNRQLGIIPNVHSRGSRPQLRATMSYGRALEIVEALGHDPVDFDL